MRIVKVDGAAREDLLKLLPEGVWVGCRYGEDDRPGTVNGETLSRLREKFPEAKFVLSFGESDLTHAERLRKLDELRPDYYEYQPPDPHKTAEFEEAMRRLDDISLPKIAGPFWVMKDDTSSIRDREPFREMMRRETVCFQLIVESAVDPGFKLSAAQRRMLDDFLEEIPSLVNDSFERSVRLDRYPLNGHRGYLLEAVVPGADKAGRGWNALTSGKVVRLLKTLEQ
ncbi:hypothetical protein CDO73_05570 [Saccharibacillus sp. O23]|uniref:hypothetical protein n=1 Tax=Saccharibacillus sp. O23 TaxID=2009338 RepID=UPI000B4E72E0|nr:hypothetical protein [Saccharibacillus sp. O23]OWR31943.1 hypothetical protein CDO73_05570 [Saccharibacillus sp. O23]